MRGENNEKWARAMRTSLPALRKWGFVDRTITQPVEGSSELGEWWTVQYMIELWIRNTIEPTLCSTV